MENIWGIDIRQPRAKAAGKAKTSQTLQYHSIYLVFSTGVASL
jgi:hypothetical protein